jgi:galactose mutarotase-like enzyme
MGQGFCLLRQVADYETLQENGVTLDVLTDKAAGLRIAVNRTGAEMVSLARRDDSENWRGFLYRDGQTAAPASGWANHATVMGYFLHRLWKEQSVYRGQIIRGGNHGFLRHFVFEAPEVKDGALIYRVPSDRVPREAYPLKVSLELSYSLSADGVRVEFLFQNEEPELDAHVSFGIHPGFAVTSPQDCRVLFPTGKYLRYMAPENFLNGKVEVIPLAGGEMPFAREKLRDSYLLGLGGVPERIFTVEDSKMGQRVVLDFSEVPFLTVWSDMNSFLCVEPCWGLPDSNPPKPFEDKVGIQTIAAGGSLRRGFRINPGFLS